MTRRRLRGVPPAASLLIAAALLGGCGGDDSTGPADGASVSTEAYAIELPDGWTQADEETTGEIDQAADPAVDEIAGEGAGAAIDATEIFFREGEGPFRTNLNVIAEPIPGSVSLEQIAEQGAQLIGDQLPGGEIEAGPDETTLDGDEAYELRYSASQGGQDLMFAAVQTLHEGTVYSITLTTGADEFEEAEAEFGQIIDSWNWS